MSAARTSGAHTGRHRCGTVAIVGRPNVGKSTLLNRLVGQKLSITSRRPQTTRWNIAGIRSTPAAQIIYIDTPGLQTEHRDGLNRHLAREVAGAVNGVDAVMMLAQAGSWGAADESALRVARDCGAPLVLVLTKIDLQADRRTLLPFIATLKDKAAFRDIVPVSARANENVDRLAQVVEGLLPEGPPLHDPDELTDRSRQFLAAEFIREKLTRLLGAELPYRSAVTVDRFATRGAMVHIHATIWVDKASQRPIVLGKGGAMLRAIGEQARRDIERLLDSRVNLRTWVKVKRGWTDSEAALRQLGYNA
jgi:GTP-binding protein Era